MSSIFFYLYCQDYHRMKHTTKQSFDLLLIILHDSQYLNCPIYNMIVPQNKQSEQVTESALNLTQQEIMAFLAYHRMLSCLNKQTLSLYDCDTNLRRNRQFYITQSHHHTSRKIESKSEKQISLSKATEKSNKKSTKPKLQALKKTDQLLISAPDGALKSKIIAKKAQNNSQRQQSQQFDINLHLPMHSKFNDGYQVNILKQESKAKKQDVKGDEEQMIEIPPERKPDQSRNIVLPFMEKSSIKKSYYGQKAPDIVALNQFINKPVSFEVQPRSIQNHIDHQYLANSNKKIKIQKSRLSSPINRLDGELKSREEEFVTANNGFINAKKETQPPEFHNTLVTPMITRNRQTFSILVKTEQSSKEDHKSVSKSKSKSKSKYVKASTLFIRKPKIYNYSPCFGKIQAEKQIDKRSVSPEVPHEPITHIYQAVTHRSIKSNKSISEKSNKRRDTPIPVEDYDRALDQNSREKYHRQYNTSEVGENYQQTFTYQNRIEPDEENQRQKDSQGYDPLSYYAIPLHTIKKPNNQNTKQQDINQKQKGSQSLKSEEQANHREEKTVKAKRKKIFQQMEKGPIRIQQKESTSTDLSEYSEEEMKMILGARGNKYKQTIVKQYIRLQRENKRNTNH